MATIPMATVPMATIPMSTIPMPRTGQVSWATAGTDTAADGKLREITVGA